MGEIDFVRILAAIGTWVALMLMLSVVGPKLGPRIEGLFRRRELRQQIRAQAGQSTSPNMSLVRAAKETQQIAVEGDALRKAVVNCLELHWFLAGQFPTVINMGQIAALDECRQMRQRVLDLVQISTKTLRDYPLLLNDLSLTKSLMGIKYLVAPSCINCPYMVLPVKDAPRVCPSARAIGYEPR